MDGMPLVRVLTVGDAVTLITLTLSGLATWRLTSLLHTEDAFGWLRKWIGIQHDEERHPIIYPDSILGNLFHCFWCLSLAAGWLVVFPVVLVGRINLIYGLLLWLGSSAFAIWLEKQIMRTQSR